MTNNIGKYINKEELKAQATSRTSHQSPSTGLRFLDGLIIPAPKQTDAL
jgi:hypothetical protein